MLLFTASDLGGNETTIEVFAKDTVDVVCKKVAESRQWDVSDIVVTELVKEYDVLERSSYMSRLYKITDTARFFYKTSEPSLHDPDTDSSGPPPLLCSSDDDVR